MRLVKWMKQHQNLAYLMIALVAFIPNPLLTWPGWPPGAQITPLEIPDRLCLWQDSQNALVCLCRFLYPMAGLPISSVVNYSLRPASAAGLFFIE